MLVFQGVLFYISPQKIHWNITLLWKIKKPVPKLGQSGKAKCQFFEGGTWVMDRETYFGGQEKTLQAVCRCRRNWLNLMYVYKKTDLRIYNLFYATIFTALQ